MVYYFTITKPGFKFGGFFNGDGWKGEATLDFLTGERGAEVLIDGGFDEGGWVGAMFVGVGAVLIIVDKLIGALVIGAGVDNGEVLVVF